MSPSTSPTSEAMEDNHNPQLPSTNDTTGRNDNSGDNTNTATTKPSSTMRQDFLALWLNNDNGFIERVAKKAEKPVQQLCQTHLPHDAEGVRKLPFYNTTLSAIIWQRDNYLVGPGYADQRKSQRPQETAQAQKEKAEELALQHQQLLLDLHPETNEPRAIPSFASPTSLQSIPPLLRWTTSGTTSQRMPYSSTALGSVQLVPLAVNFIPSPTVKHLLMPIVLDLPSGALHRTIVQATANAIPLAQPLLDEAVKSSVMKFMENPEWRQVIKNKSTMGIKGSGTKE